MEKLLKRGRKGDYVYWSREEMHALSQLGGVQAVVYEPASYSIRDCLADARSHLAAWLRG